MKIQTKETISKEIYTCAGCGFCRFGCPVYKETATERLTARGRNYLLKRILEGTLDYDKDVVDAFFTCALCGNCNEICPAGVDSTETVSELRKSFVKQQLLPESFHHLKKAIVEKGNPFSKEREERGNWIPPKLLHPQKSKNLYFVGCSTSYSSTRIARSVLKILEKADYDFTILGNQENCCGDALIRMGEQDLSDRLKKKNVEKFEEYGIETVFASCAGCYKTLKNTYPDKYQVFHISQVLSDLVRSDRLKFKKGLDKRVLYFDGCDIGRHCGTYEEPRELLKAIPGLELLEFDYNRQEGICCGGPFAASDPGLASKMALSRVKEAEALRADIIAVACPTCMINLREGARTGNCDIEISDITMMLPGLLA